MNKEKLLQKPQLNVDTAFQKVGGFGLFQVLVTIALTVLRNSGMYMYYGFGFLTLDQTYVCRQNSDQLYQTCPTEEICHQLSTGITVDYKIDIEDKNYMLNWISQMDLMCTPRVTVQWIVTVYYITFGIGGLLCWPIPDLHGRKFTIKLFGTIHLICNWCMLLVPNYWARLVAFAVMGLCQLKNAACYTLLFEMVQSTNKGPVCSILNAWDTLTMTVICLYSLFISRNWFYLQLFMTSIGTLSFLIVLLLVPESPKWLLINGRKQEAVEALNKIAKINGVDSKIYDDDQFEEFDNSIDAQALKKIDVSIKSIDSVDKKERQSTYFGFIMLNITFTCVAIISWMTIYSIAAVPGNKFINGIICGVAESGSSLLSGVLMKYFNDVNASLFLCAVCFCFNIVYYQLGAGSVGVVAQIALFLAIIGIGGLVNLQYLMMELRMPPGSLGASMVILMTVSITAAGITPQISYFPHPIPLLVMLSLVFVLAVVILYLPPAGQFLTKKQLNDSYNLHRSYNPLNLSGMQYNQVNTNRLSDLITRFNDSKIEHNLSKNSSQREYDGVSEYAAPSIRKE